MIDDKFKLFSNGAALFAVGIGTINGMILGPSIVVFALSILLIVFGAYKLLESGK